MWVSLIRLAPTENTMLGFVIFLVLLFILLIVGVWYYYSWTPQGVLADVEANVQSADLLKQAAEKAQYVEEAQKDIKDSMQDVDAQKFNPVKNYRK